MLLRYFTKVIVYERSVVLPRENPTPETTPCEHSQSALGILITYGYSIDSTSIWAQKRFDFQNFQPNPPYAGTHMRRQFSPTYNSEKGQLRLRMKRKICFVNRWNGEHTRRTINGDGLLIFRTWYRWHIHPSSILYGVMNGDVKLFVHHTQLLYLIICSK